MCPFKQLLLVAVWGLALAGNAFAQELSLEDCLTRGAVHNQEVKAYQLAVKGAQEGVKEAWGGFLPTLSFSYDRSRVLNSHGEGIETDFYDQTSDRLTARLTQPLFTGFNNVAQLKKAKLLKQYSELEVKHIQAQLSREIRFSFYDILRAGLLVEKWQDSVGRLERQKEVVQAWAEKELAPRIRVLEVAVELSNARQQLIAARSDDAIARSRMKELLAFEIGDDLQISGALDTDITLPCPSAESCTELALAQRADLELMGLNVDVARQEVRAVMARNLPQVQLDASWTDYQRDYESASLSDDDRDYYSLLLNVTFKPVQGGRNLFAWRRQRFELERLQALEINLRQTIVSEVCTRFEQVRQNLGLVETARDSLDEAREAYRLARRSAELGVFSLGELLNAELRLTRAEIGQVDAAHRLNQAFAQLEYAMGY